MLNCLYSPVNNHSICVPWCLCAASVLPVKLHLCQETVQGQQHGPVNTGTGFWRPCLHWLWVLPVWCHPKVVSLWTLIPTLCPPRLEITKVIILPAVKQYHNRQYFGTWRSSINLRRGIFAWKMTETINKHHSRDPFQERQTCYMCCMYRADRNNKSQIKT